MATAILVDGGFFIKRFRRCGRTGPSILNKQVDRIVLIAGDADFVPAAKLARREGIDFILDPMWRSIPDSLNEHIDGLRSTCPRPRKAIEEAGAE